MNLEKAKRYRDRNGTVWSIYDLSNGQRENIGPVTAGRWEGKRFLTRTFLRDGRYNRDEKSDWDLIEEVP